MSTTTIRRGTRVLAWNSATVGIGHVEGARYASNNAPAGTQSADIVRWADGTVDSWTRGRALLAPVDAGTVLVEDQFNNVGRYCSVDAVNGRAWCVEAALSRDASGELRYLVVLHDTGEVRMVNHRSMSNLY